LEELKYDREGEKVLEKEREIEREREG